MSGSDVARWRLASQQIAGSRFTSCRELVGWMGALQAQDYAMVRWAVGLRVPGSTERSVEQAIARGELIRTHLLRPTWHLVAAEDVCWMLELTAPRIRASLRARHRELGLSEAILATASEVLDAALSGGKHLPRSTLAGELARAGLATDENRAAHLLMHAELDGLVCSGATLGGKPTYALLRERAPAASSIPRQQALASLARRYFTSHGPATLQDFVWWSGLGVKDARQALELAQPELDSQELDSQVYLAGKGSLADPGQDETVHLLPAYDEFLISYTDRRASLPAERHRTAVSTNGIFRPVVVVGGQVAGTWKRTVTKGCVSVEIALFGRASKRLNESIGKAAARYAEFLEKPIELGLER